MTPNGFDLFTDAARLSDPVKIQLVQEGGTIYPYEDIFKRIEHYVSFIGFQLAIYPTATSKINVFRSEVHLGKFGAVKTVIQLLQILLTRQGVC